MEIALTLRHSDDTIESNRITLVARTVIYNKAMRRGIVDHLGALAARASRRRGQAAISSPTMQGVAREKSGSRNNRLHRIGHKAEDDAFILPRGE